MLRPLLRNPVYVARFERDGPVAQLKPLVDDATFDAVQRRLDQHAATPRAEPGRFPLTGFVRCPTSASNMPGETLKTVPGRRPRAMRYYRCIDGRRKDGACNMRVGAEQIETQTFAAIDALVSRLSVPHVVDGLRRQWAREQQPKGSDAKQEKKRAQTLRNRIKQNERLIDAATTQFLLATITKPAYDRAIAAAERAIAAGRPQPEH
jgi:hypothetical protein